MSEMPIVASAGLMKSSTPSGRLMLYWAKSLSMQATSTTPNVGS